MDCQVTLSTLALDDLEEIVRYVAKDDPPAAGRRQTAARHSRISLSSAPPQQQRPAARREKAARAAHLLFYRFDANTLRVEILRFWHGARDQSRLRL